MVKRLSPALLVLALARCFPDALDVTGLPCDGMHGCGDGYTCSDDVCYRVGEIDAGLANWLPNPGFEESLDGGNNIADWAVRNGKFAVYTVAPHSGLRSARMFSTMDGGESPALTTQLVPVHDTFATDTWCGLAWVRADTPNDAGVQVSLFLRERDDAGIQINQNTAQKVLATGAWQPIEEKLGTIGAPNLDFRVAFVKPALLGYSVDVDDVAMKRSPDTNCVWP